MSTFDFRLPDIGEGVMEGEIVKWLVQPGDAVSEDEPVVEVMTDKATVTITSPKTGKVISLGGDEGSVIPVHTTLVILEIAGAGEAEEAAAVSAPAAASAPAAGQRPAVKPAAGQGPAATAVGDIREELPGTAIGAATSSVAAVAASASPAAGDDYYCDKPLATPATRKLARELSVDLRTVRASGAHGRVLQDDVRRVAQAGSAVASSTAMTSSAPAASTAPTRATKVAAGSALPLESFGEETRVPLKGVRKRIFEAMGRSKHTAAHFTFVEECDVSALKALRGRLKPLAAEQGVKLSFLPFIIKAVVAALKKSPQLNVAYDVATDEIVQRLYYNIGMAVSTERGLMVPVIKDADRLSVLEIAREISRVGEAAKTGKISPDDLRGSTFTVTSLGQQGGLFATPILNTPEVGILGVHQMKEKPVVRDGQIVVGDVMLLSLSFDHRIIDGHVGAAFAYDIIGYLQQPDRLWLEMG